MFRAGHGYVALDCPRAPQRVAAAASFGYRLLRGYRKALRYLRREKAAVVVGLGSFASVPTALAAARLRVPLVLLEQNAVVGRANRRLARLASVLCLGFAPTFDSASNEKLRPPCAAFLTGTPIRGAFASMTPRVGSPKRLVVMGGSSGARLLNQSVPAAISTLGSQFGAWQIVHQTGPTDCQATEAAYRALGVAARVIPFLDDPTAILANADIVISRAGGSTLAELAALRVPPILVPLDSALDDHQRRNAQAFAAAGAAAVVDRTAEPAALIEQLTILLRRLIADAARASRWGELAALARPYAAADVARIILQALSGSQIADCPELLTCRASPDSIDAFAA